MFSRIRGWLIVSSRQRQMPSVKPLGRNPSARDVVALAHRKAVVERFRTLLRDQDAFEEARRDAGGRRETVWQHFLEANPWILGVGLAGQLLTAWDDSRLEQVVAGFSI